MLTPSDDARQEHIGRYVAVLIGRSGHKLSSGRSWSCRCRRTREWGERCICCCTAAGTLRLFLHIVLPFLSSALVHPCLLCPSMFSIIPKLCATVWTLCFSAEVQLFVGGAGGAAAQTLCWIVTSFLHRVLPVDPPTQSVSSYPKESTTLALLISHQMPLFAQLGLSKHRMFPRSPDTLWDMSGVFSLVGQSGRSLYFRLRDLWWSPFVLARMLLETCEEMRSPPWAERRFCCFVFFVLLTNAHTKSVAAFRKEREIKTHIINNSWTFIWSGSVSFNVIM